MAKPNYNFQKRQKEMAKKKKQEEKRQRKLDKNAGHAAESAEPADGPGRSAAGEEARQAPK